MPIPQVALAGEKVSQIGLGLMQLTWTPSPPSEDKSFAAMKAAIDAAGSAKTAISSATFYGNPGDPFANLRLIGAFVKKWVAPAARAEFGGHLGLTPGTPSTRTSSSSSSRAARLSRTRGQTLPTSEFARAARPPDR